MSVEYCDGADCKDRNVPEEMNIPVKYIGGSFVGLTFDRKSIDEEGMTIKYAPFWRDFQGGSTVRMTKRAFFLR